MKGAIVDSDLIVLAIKPQNCRKVFRELKPLLEELRVDDPSYNPMILSIMAGVPIIAMTEGLGSDRIIRSMPNTPAMIGEFVFVSCVFPF